MLLGVLAGGGAAIAYDPDAEAYFARMTVQPDAERKACLNTLVSGLKFNGLYSKLDRLYILAAHDAQAALLDVRGTGATDLVVNGTVTFVEDRGYKGDGSTGYLAGVGAPSAFTQYTQDSASYCTYIASAGDMASQLALVGRAGVTDSFFVSPRIATGTLSVRLNSGTGDAWGVLHGLGCSIISRTSSTAVEAYKDGVSLGAKSRTSSAKATSARTLARGDAVYNKDTVSIHCFGAGLTSAEAGILYSMLDAYMTAIGYVPVESVPAIASSLSIVSGINLPGTPGTPAGEGICCTGLARDNIDGTWWVGNHYTASVVHLSADFTTVISEYVVGAGTLAALGAEVYSVQGVAYDTTNDTIYFVAKGLSGGATTQIVHIAKNGTLLDAIPKSSANGLAYDSIRDNLIYSTAGTFNWINKTTGAALFSYTASSPPDQVHFVAASNRLLYSSDPSANGTLRVVTLSNDYGIPIEEKVITLVGADAIEGLVLHGGNLYITNDGFFHAGSPPKNRMLTYDGVGI